MRTLFCILILLASCYISVCVVNGHRISKRFVYPLGSVVQFAMGLALPATVTGRNIATNSGILVNYALPTNITELKIPFSSTTRIAQEQLLSKIILLLKNKNFDEKCLYKSLCYLNENRHHSRSLWYELLQAVIREIFNYYGMFNSNKPQLINYLKNNCKEITKECNFLNYLF